MSLETTMHESDPATGYAGDVAPPVAPRTGLRAAALSGAFSLASDHRRDPALTSAPCSITIG